MTDRLTALFSSQQKQTKYQTVQQQDKLARPDDSVSDVVVPPGDGIFHSLQKHGLVKLPEKSGWTDFTGKFWSTKYTKAIGRGNVYVQLPDSILVAPIATSVSEEKKDTEEPEKVLATEKSSLDEKSSNTQKSPSNEQKGPIQVEAQIQYKGLYRLNSVEKVVIQLTEDGQSATSEFETKPATVQGHEAPHGKGILEFKVEKREGEKISGSYKLSHPVDVGQFELQKGMTHGEQCLVM